MFPCAAGYHRVLIPQGHPVFLTSRPARLIEERFYTVLYRVRLCPLSPSQQDELVKKMVSGSRAEDFLQHIHRKRAEQHSSSKGMDICATPQLLTLLISIYENGLDAGALPCSVLEVYEVAFQMVVKRATASTVEELSGWEGADSSSSLAQLLHLLQETVFLTHASQQRVVQKEHLLIAALKLYDARLLERILRRTAMPVAAPPKVGDWVEIVKGDFAGQCGILMSCVAATNQKGRVVMRRYAVQFANENVEAGLALSSIVSSGMDEAACLAWSKERRGAALLEACASLPIHLQELLCTVVEKKTSGDTTILDVLQSYALRTFQEYLAARALCSGMRIRGSPPWLWTTWWDNTLNLGIEVGSRFRQSLLEVARTEGAVEGHGHLNLRAKIGGDRAVSLRAVGLLLRVATTANLSQNNLGEQGMELLSPAIAESDTLAELDISENRLSSFGSNGAQLIADAINTNQSLKMVDLRGTVLQPGDVARLRQIASKRRASRRRLQILTDYSGGIATHW